MKNFTYYQPKSVEAAVGLLGEQYGRTELLAGGTDLMDLMKEYVAQPDKVVSLSGVAGQQVNNITQDNAGRSFSIGAMVKLAAIADNDVLRQSFPALTTAAGMIGGPQIRNMGTLGGNLCQRNRCWYFRDEEVPCLIKGGTKCFAFDGENQYHAVFTRGHPCVIVHPSTLAPVLIALNAKAEVQGPKGKRTIPLAEFFHAPTKPEHREHVLAANEVLLSVSIPMSSAKNASYEVRHKQSYDWPLVQAAVAFDMKGGKASNVKIVLGHVAPTPHLATFAAKALEGQEVNERTAGEAGKAATIERADTVEGKPANLPPKPLAQNGYKLRLIEVAVKRAILTAAGAQRYWEV